MLLYNARQIPMVLVVSNSQQQQYLIQIPCQMYLEINPKKKKKSPESSTNKCLQHTPYIFTCCSASQSICCNLSVLSQNFGNMVLVVVQVTKNIGDERGNISNMQIILICHLVCSWKSYCHKINSLI